MLVFYDGPQLALFETDRQLKMLALAVSSPKGENLYFSCEMLDKAFKAYAEGRIDLNFAFKYSSGRHLYFFDWSRMESGGNVSLRPATVAEIADAKYYPDRGFFEEDHTENWKEYATSGARRQFKIDGRWDAEDFSRFYNKIGDIYAFLSFIEDLSDETTGGEELKEIADAVRSPAWRGGGSYVGFYDDIAMQAKSIRPLRVSGIQYNSPGHIEVEGRASVFQEMNDVLISFSTDELDIKDLCSAINTVLTREEMRRADKSKSFSSESVEKYVRDRTTRLADALNIQSPERLFNVCNKNTLVYAKVTLSYYRRVRDLYAFEKEGRVTFNGQDATGSSTANAAGS